MIGFRAKTFFHTSRKKNRGFTLVEILVAFGIFVLLLGGAFGVIRTTIQAQRVSLEKQNAIEEAIFVREYISRALRGAKKELGFPASCLTDAGRGWNFQISESRIRFLDKDERCREIFLDEESGQMKERISQDEFASNFDPEHTITSNDFIVSYFGVIGNGLSQGSFSDLDYEQPSITFSIQFTNRNTETLVFGIQTTVAQRALDVQR